MQMIVKGDFEDISSFKLITELYALLPLIFKELDKRPFAEDGKKELTVLGEGIKLNGYKIKTIINTKTNITTIKLEKGID